MALIVGVALLAFVVIGTRKFIRGWKAGRVEYRERRKAYKP